MNTDTKTKIVEWLRGERDWEQMDMARECLDAIHNEASAAFREGQLDGMDSAINALQDLLRAKEPT